MNFGAQKKTREEKLLRRNSLYEEALEELINELPGRSNRRYNPQRLLSPEDERAEFIDRLRSQVIGNSRRKAPGKKAQKNAQKKDAP